MTQVERLIARLNTIDTPGLYEIVIYVTPEKTIGFWIVEKKTAKVEGLEKCDTMQVDSAVFV
jgi:hypothetical protein